MSEAPLLISFREAARLLSTSRHGVALRVQRGNLVAVGKGRGRRIIAASLTAYVSQLTEAAATARPVSPRPVIRIATRRVNRVKAGLAAQAGPAPTSRGGRPIGRYA